MISIWDPEKSNTVRFDLWTKDMMQDEMSKFVFQTFLLMSEAFSTATGNKEMANEILQFAEHFGIKTGLIRKKTEAEIAQESNHNEIKPFTLNI